MKEVNLSNYRSNLELNFLGKCKYLLWLLVSNTFFLTNIPYPQNFKAFLLRCFGAKIGHTPVIKPWVKIKYPWLLEMGNHVWLGEGVWIDNLSKVTLEDQVCVSQEGLLITGNHRFDQEKFNTTTAEIHLERGVWIGARAMVTAGVHAKSHAVLLANSVAVRNLEAYSVYRGNPCEKIKDRVIQ